MTAVVRIQIQNHITELAANDYQVLRVILFPRDAAEKTFAGLFGMLERLDVFGAPRRKEPLHEPIFTDDTETNTDNITDD